MREGKTCLRQGNEKDNERVRERETIEGCIEELTPTTESFVATVAPFV